MNRAPLFEIFVKNGGLKKGSVKLKHPTQLTQFLKTIWMIVDDISSASSKSSLALSSSSSPDKSPSLASCPSSRDQSNCHVKEEEEKVILSQIIEVLEQHEFGGVYQKCILRYAIEEGKFGIDENYSTFGAIWQVLRGPPTVSLLE